VRYCVAQQSEGWGRKIWWNVIDQANPEEHIILARSEDEGNARFICSTMNMYHDAITSALVRNKR